MVVTLAEGSRPVSGLHIGDMSSFVKLVLKRLKLFLEADVERHADMACEDGSRGRTAYGREAMKWLLDAFRRLEPKRCEGLTLNGVRKFSVH